MLSLFLLTAEQYRIISSVQLLSCVRLFETPWTAARQASLSITNSRSLLTLMSIESVMPSLLSTSEEDTVLQKMGWEESEKG